MRTMKALLSLVAGASALALGAGTAFAGGSEGSLGVGAEAQINGVIEGISANYDMGQFHLGGVVGLVDPGNYYHIHSTA